MVIAQLFFITQPPLESAHTWRQCLTNMIARNLSIGDGSTLYPTIDYGGESEGIMASEFPVFQKILSYGYRFFGHNHWLGRLLNLLMSVGGVYAFYLIIETYFNKRHAFFSAIGLLFSLWFIYSRKAMPDTFSVSLVLMAFYLYSRWLQNGKWSSVLLATLLLSLGVLSKIPAVLAIVPLPLLLIRKTTSMRQTVVLFVSGTVAMIPVYWWYFRWVPHLVALDNNPLFFPRTLSNGWKEIGAYPIEMIQQFTFHAFFSYLGFVLFCGGLVWAVHRKRYSVLLTILASSLVMFFFILKTGLVFPLHSYYMVPFAPVMALVLGYFLSETKARWAFFLLVVFCVESIANQHDDYRISDKMEVYLDLESEANRVSDRTNKIVCNGGPNPQMMYFINRKGWSLKNEEITLDTLHKLRRLGCQYYFQVGVNGVDQLPEFPFQKVIEKPHLRVYNLDLKSNTP